MKKIILIVGSTIVGSLLFSSEQNIDTYYENIDTDYPVLAAHKKIDNQYGKDLMRKRAYKRKRMRRLPNNGK
jgi:hypothetical protein|tara:strand:+ start:569 stop:784 length:216 start_codon:yes stop_codon:yes gene_type:complete